MDTDLTKDEERLAQEAMDAEFGKISEPPKDKRGEEIIKTHNRARSALKQAEKAAHKGNMAAAKKWIDIATQLMAAQTRLEAIAPTAQDYAQEEKLRAELRERVAKFVEQDGGMQRWNMRREVWEEMTAEAKRTGGPMPPPLPPRPAHWADRCPPDLRAKILGEEVVTPLSA